MLSYISLNLYANNTHAVDTVSGLLDEGRAQYQQGHYEKAIILWEQALFALQEQQQSVVFSSHKLSANVVELTIELQRRLASAEQSLGLTERAMETLHEALNIAKEAGSIQQSPVLSQLGELYLGRGRWQQAGDYLGEGVVLARAFNQPGILAYALNNLGNAFALAAYTGKALAAYEESLQLAITSNNTPLQIKLLMNLVRLQLLLDQDGLGSEWQTARETFNQAVTHVQRQADSLEKAGDLITLALLSKKLQHHSALEKLKDKNKITEALTGLRHDLLEQASRLAKHFNDPLYLAYTHGYLGQEDETRRAYEQALQRTRQAIFFAEQARDPANLYLWQWQLGRILRAKGQNTAAITAYRQAVDTLNPIRSNLMNNYRAGATVFRERIQPVYFGLADLLLEQAEQQTTAGQILKDTADPNTLDPLREARDTVEILKTAELQDYFQDECTVALQAKETQLDSIDPRTAVIYPIILPQRLALLVSINNQLQYKSVSVAAVELEQTAHRFRRHLQIRSRHAYLRGARQLYDWIIRPLAGLLNQAEVDTLVFVPDGVLRTVPFATLQDGERFLIEHYAIAMTPSLSLTDPQPLSREDTDVLITGLSEGVQGFSPLPSVPRELSTVQSLVGGEILQDEQYSVANLSGALKNTEYSVLHMATHGVFGGSDAESFLLTYDDKLNMQQLGDMLRVGIFRDKPLELLTLSACQTALGNERAALGLAGVAVQSGARSAAASLWFVDDAATAAMMTAFYEQLAETQLSKAHALQKAQISLLKQARYRHPIYWGPYLLIGNWL